MTRRQEPAANAARWAIRDARPRLSEVVRKAKSEGPQWITVHGREEVVVLSVEDYRRMKGQPTGEILVQAMQDPRVRGLEFEREGTRATTRPVKL